MNRITRNGLVESLCGFFGEQVEFEDNGRSITVVTPFITDHGDAVELILEEEESGEWTLTDGGMVHQEVALISGITDPSADIWRGITELANEYGVTWGGGELWTRVTTGSELGPQLFALSSLISKAVHVAPAHVQKPSIHFWEELEIYFQEKHIFYHRNEPLLGASEVLHTVDFALKNGKTHIVQAIASEASMRRSLNIFWDITDRHPNVVPVGFVDEEKVGYSKETFKQLSYKAKVYLWSQRGEFEDYWRESHPIADSS